MAWTKPIWVGSKLRLLACWIRPNGKWLPHYIYVKTTSTPTLCQNNVKIGCVNRQRQCSYSCIDVGSTLRHRRCLDAIYLNIASLPCRRGWKARNVTFRRRYSDCLMLYCKRSLNLLHLPSAPTRSRNIVFPVLCSINAERFAFHNIRITAGYLI